jgi:hypothetical protein
MVFKNFSNNINFATINKEYKFIVIFDMFFKYDYITSK